VAPAIAVDTWDAQGVRLSEVVSALSDLRHQSIGRTPTRTAVMTLVGVTLSDDQAYAAARALQALGRHHPARIVLLRPEADQAATLDGRAALFATDADGHQVYFEEVRLTVAGQAAHHLDSVVEPFTLSDLPVAVWYVGDVPEPGDPLLSVATAVIVDSRDAADSGRMRSLLELARRRTIVDLSWIRLRPWRELLADLFASPPRQAWLQGVESLEITGKIGPRQLLGGWLMAQLRLLPSQITLTDAQHVEIRLECRRESERATFEVGRGRSQRAVSARATVPGEPASAERGGTILLADDPLATSLAEGLTHLEPDTIWERALSAATVLSV
jgi:glucose-6-phosphate dehydrogenase assembly protein OpcA